MLLESSELQRCLDGDPPPRDRGTDLDPGSEGVLADMGLQLREPPSCFRPRRRWLTTEPDGLSWEARTRVAGHLSGSKGQNKKADKNKLHLVTEHAIKNTSSQPECPEREN